MTFILGMIVGGAAGLVIGYVLGHERKYGHYIINNEDDLDSLWDDDE